MDRLIHGHAVDRHVENFNARGYELESMAKRADQIVPPIFDIFRLSIFFRNGVVCSKVLTLDKWLIVEVSGA